MNTSNDSPKASTVPSSIDYGQSKPTKISDEGGKEEPAAQSNKSEDPRQSYLPKKSLAFWAIVSSLCVAGLMTALEATITSTALPTIIEALGGADSYIWVVNIFFLTQ
jgi:hypothetical protein